MKNNDERNERKAEVETVNGKPVELNEDKLDQVAGGVYRLTEVSNDWIHKAKPLIVLELPCYTTLENMNMPTPEKDCASCEKYDSCRNEYKE